MLRFVSGDRLGHLLYQECRRPLKYLADMLKKGIDLHQWVFDVLAFTWNLQTMAGRPAIEATLRQTIARTQATNYHILPRRTLPRRAM